MFAITIRGLADETRAGLRRIAAAKGVSVEALARDSLTALARSEDSAVIVHGQTTPVLQGFGEQIRGWNMPQQSAAPSFETIWGALAGRVHVAPGTDLTAPTGEVWDAEAGLL